MSGIGTKSPASATTSAMHELAAHDIAEEPHHEREGARHLGDDVERQHDELRLGEAREIAERALGAHAEIMHRNEDDERQRGRRLELAGRCLDARQHAGEIGG